MADRLLRSTEKETKVFEEELARASAGLPRGVRLWVKRAIRSDWFELGSGAYDDGGRRCPIAAGAQLAGVWDAGGVMPGNEKWGTPGGPAPAVEEFAAYFDLCAGDVGLERALAVVRATLEVPHAEAA